MSTTTGWPPGLLQDDCKKLSQWFASRIDARHVVRQVCREIRQKRMEKEMSDKQPEAQGYGIWDMNIDGQRIMGFTPQQWFDREEQHQSAIERKDALLRQALDALENHAGNYKLSKAEGTIVSAVVDAITKELQ